MKNKTFDEIVEDFVTFMSLCHEGKKAGVPIREFDGAIAMHPDITDAKAELSSGSGFFRDVKVSDLHSNVSIKLLAQLSGDKDNPIKNAFALHCLRTAPSRGLPLAAHHLNYKFGAVLPSGEVLSGERIVGLRNGYWRMLTPQVEPPEAEVHNTVQMSLGIQFTLRYEWQVLIGFEDKPRISFMTDPTGVSALFRLRDIPEGRQRRTALRHWVAEHWRQDRKDPAMERKVREHLRGASTFTWNGLRGQVRPSTFDEARAEQAKEIRRIDHLMYADYRAKGFIERSNKKA